MQIKDKFFIFISIVLVILFGVQVFLNIQRGCYTVPAANITSLSPQEEDTGEILTKLKEAGLNPQEADYYEVIK